MQENSDDEFESADEGESIPIVISDAQPATNPIELPINENSISNPSLPPVTDGWDDWNVHDELASEKSKNPAHAILLQQDSASSLSSSPSKTG
ncbi:unnamed protein product, partial [Rotaria magnacalcarata]